MQSDRNLSRLVASVDMEATESRLALAPPRRGVAERARRVSVNGARFRDVGRRIEHRRLARIDETVIPLLCECGMDSCAATLSVPIAVYMRVRSDAALFFVFAGHRDPVEDVVGTGEGTFDVVREHPGSIRVGAAARADVGISA